MSLLSRIRDGLFGRAVPPGPAADIMVGGLPLYQQFQRIGGSKTPQKVSSIIRMADVGKPSQLVDLSNDCRQQDGHLHSNLFTRETSLATIELVVDPWMERGAKEPSNRDRDVAWFVTDALEQACGDGQKLRGLRDMIKHLQSAIYMGFADDEIVWRKDGRYLVPAGFSPIDQRRFEFRQSDGVLVWQDQWGTGAARGVDLMAEFPGKFLQHQPSINGDVPAREGLNKLLVWAATFRNWDLADWLALAELTWKPWRIGMYPKETGAADIDNLRTALRYLTTNGIAAIRNDHKIEIKWPEGQTGSKSNHQALAEWLGAEMSKAILGQTLTTESGDRGARSLGEVHERVRQDIVEYDARCIADTLKRDLVRWLVWFNFGPSVPLPNVYFNTDDVADLGSFARGLKDLQDAKLRVPAKWARQHVGIPEPEDDEELVGDGWEEVDTEELDEAA